MPCGLGHGAIRSIFEQFADGIQKHSWCSPQIHPGQKIDLVPDIIDRARRSQLEGAGGSHEVRERHLAIRCLQSAGGGAGGTGGAGGLGKVGEVGC